MASRSAVARRALGARLGGGRGTWLRRAAVFGAPAAYLVALAVVTVSWGLPVARDQLFIWLVAGIAAFSVPAWRGWGRLLLEWLPFFGLLAAYDYLRGAVSVTAGQAHVIPQIDFDKALFARPRAHGLAPAAPVGRGPRALVRLRGLGRLHDALLRRVGDGRDPLALRARALPAVRGDRGPAQPRRVRHLLGLSGAASVAGGRRRAHPARSTASCPTVWGHLGVPTAQSTYENSGFVNTVAAMPSLHAAFPLMLLLFFWSAGRWVRLGLGLYTLAMAFTLVYGGEHFVADILAGWAMALGVHALVRRGVSAERPPCSSARSRAR